MSRLQTLAAIAILVYIVAPPLAPPHAQLIDHRRWKHDGEEYARDENSMGNSGYSAEYPEVAEILRLIAV